jgi:hypothetical protein
MGIVTHCVACLSKSASPLFQSALGARAVGQLGLVLAHGPAPAVGRCWAEWLVLALSLFPAN